MAKLPWSVPAEPTSVGLDVVAQGVALESVANPLGPITTRGLPVTLGGWQ